MIEGKATFNNVLFKNVPRSAPAAPSGRRRNWPANATGISRRDPSCAPARRRNARARDAGHVAAEHDAAAQRDHGGDLAQREIRIAPVMAAVNDLDPDRAGIDVFLAGPARHAGMPGALALRHALHDAAVFQHDVVRRDLGARGAKLGDRAFHIRHAGVVQHDHVGQAALVAVAIVRRRDDVGSDRGIRGKSLHVRVGPGDGKGALTLRINTSSRERTRRHISTQIQAGERQTRFYKNTNVYYSFTLASSAIRQSGSGLAFCRSVCGVHQWPGLRESRQSDEKRAKPGVDHQRFLNAKCRY